MADPVLYRLAQFSESSFVTCRCEDRIVAEAVFAFRHGRQGAFDDSFDHVHEFARTVSRLREMRSAEFLAEARRSVDTSLT